MHRDLHDGKHACAAEWAKMGEAPQPKQVFMFARFYPSQTANSLKKMNLPKIFGGIPAPK
jgi:hypothetical protein